MFYNILQCKSDVLPGTVLTILLTSAKWLATSAPAFLHESLALSMSSRKFRH
jgi:hypothetical protein